MSSQQLLLDTDILSLLMRQNAVVVSRGDAYLAEHRQFTISIITRYEILRGLKATGADQQASRFEAADIYADLYKRGELIGDADILIAASALANGCGIVTNNEAHFRRIKNLRVISWVG